MRIKTTPKPVGGDSRVVQNKFLIIPRECNGEVRWLEVASYREKFSGKNGIGLWFVEEWLDTQGGV